MHKASLVHIFHHIGHEWMERRKRKRVVLEELVELKPNLKIMASNGLVDCDI